VFAGVGGVDVVVHPRGGCGEGVAVSVGNNVCKGGIEGGFIAFLMLRRE